jgi:hypothetical protein
MPAHLPHVALDERTGVAYPFIRGWRSQQPHGAAHDRERIAQLVANDLNGLGGCAVGDMSGQNAAGITVRGHSQERHRHIAPIFNARFA